MKYQDPKTGKTLEFKLINRSELITGDFQRPLSTGLTNKLVDSISLGFISPVIVTPNLEVIDGQHRLAAMDKHLPDYEVPCVVVPMEFKHFPLALNVEKADAIKDKCEKLHKFYMWHVENTPDEGEMDYTRAVNYMSHLFPMAFAFKEFGLSSPSLVETCVKLLSGTFLETPFVESVEERRRQGEVIADLERSVAELAMENNIRDFNLKKAMVTSSKSSLWGRARGVNVDFYEGMAMLKMKIMETDWSYLAKY